MTNQMQGFQMQLNNLRQDLQNIMQMAGQLSQQEQNNAMELQRLRQLESSASQQLQRIQQICSSLSNSLNQVSGMTQQFGAGTYTAGTQFASPTQYQFNQPYTVQTGTTQFGYGAPTYGTGTYAQNLGQYSALQPEYRNPSTSYGQFGVQPHFGAQAFSPNVTS